MPKQTKICRVCGKTYEACNSQRTGSSVFNWKEVACSPECGTEYFKRVELSRNPVKTPKVSAKKKKHVEEVTEVASEPTVAELAVDAEVAESLHVEAESVEE